MSGGMIAQSGTTGGTTTTGGAGSMTGGVGATTGGAGGMTGGTSALTGGSGGSPLPVDCATDGDIQTGMACAEEANGWFAIKTVIDVWWQGTSVRDPGRGNIDVYLLGRLEGVCPDGSNGVGTMKACGTTLPPFTSDIACDAFQIEFPNEIWDSPMMPRFRTTGSTTAFTPGGLLTLNAATGLVGINLIDAMQDVAAGFPTATDTGSFACDEIDGTMKTGKDCFPDHDGDGNPGITIRLRTDLAVYDGPYDNGKCSSGCDYKYRGAPTSVDIAAAGCAGGGVRAQYVRIGLRTRLGGAGEIGADCMSGVGDAEATFLDSRAWECLVDPATVPEGDVDHPGNVCTPSDIIFVDENVPAYQVLAKGAVPGASDAPLGWLGIGRDIPATPSVGPRSALVRLGDLGDTEPACEQVRSAAYPAL